MDFVFSLTSFVAPCVFKKNDDRLRSRFSISSFGKRSIFPFQKKSFLQTYKGLIESKHKDSIGQDSKNLDSRIENLIDTPHSNCNKLISKSALLFPPLTNSSYKKPHFISFRLIKDAKPYEKNSKTILRNKKVAIFIGCLSNYNYTQVGESLLFILDKLGIDVLIPKQECCGAPAYFTGDIKSVIFLIKKNIELFESFFDEIDAMIIPEATCAAMIMVDWKHSLSYCEDSKHWIKRLEALLPKIHMATEYLYNQTNLLEILKTYNKKDIKITYHDPCHAKKVLNIAKEPRAFIEANYNLLEMKECDRCCGFGGVSIQSEKYHLAYNAGIPKAKNILDSGASIVSAECSACRMQLNNALDNQQANIVFKHPLELVRESLRC
ncbi:hypothetical protein CCY99_03070 [Helicobacter sp. 16-1353]|nr:hypothetical protein CCY99_03070 [Helicobacter sp. 16-1353]